MSSRKTPCASPHGLVTKSRSHWMATNDRYLDVIVKYVLVPRVTLWVSKFCLNTVENYRCQGSVRSESNSGWSKRTTLNVAFDKAHSISSEAFVTWEALRRWSYMPKLWSIHFLISAFYQ